jgi:hypothetical protein
VGAFVGGAITSNGGVVLLAADDKRIGLGERLARCFNALRLPEAVTHAVPELLRQRTIAIALGHEDLIDHDALPDDPVLTAVLDKPGGRLAGKSTINRLEHCQRGEMENRLKECQGDLIADRTPTPTMRANQLRLRLASFADVLLYAVRWSRSGSGA